MKKKINFTQVVFIYLGYGVQQESVAAASKKIWTSGCIEIIRVWAERNLYTIAGIALGAALSQLFVIYLAKTLEGQVIIILIIYHPTNILYIQWGK